MTMADPEEAIEFDPSDFPACPICGTDRWLLKHSGPVRDGAYGRSVSSSIRSCAGCGVERLAEGACLESVAYREDTYRRHVGQDHDIGRHYASHDELALFTLQTIWPTSLRGKRVADVGCGGGSLLDHMRGLPEQIVAVDPAEGFAQSLISRGYRWFPTVGKAAEEFAGQIDVAFAIQVIKHVDDPREFLDSIRSLLKPDGQCVVSTPNRADILMELLPDAFPAFFYRTQHRWAFDADSLSACARAAGFHVDSVRHVHRYGMANSLLWLRDKKPSGRSSLEAIDGSADALWRMWLESTGRADNLYLILRAPS
ncbi:class I SAM-dependent methyltransferase [Hyphomicrobium sp.]|uniref:class I SAM-dependent methyltransferase n=1 Tax=Hyphomicrobium sp. TaxID=82 RepID=UPI0025C439C3|nr:class I SAM-dependent methyltransferase [Hyphomicrobium sp.]MCC7250941.1 class I SAM-dependent methyltransferase [Hyphomicrobium sp.]